MRRTLPFVLLAALLPANAGAAVRLAVATVAGEAAGRVSVAVLVSADAGENVGTVVNDISFDPEVLRLAPGEQGAPDCAVEDGIRHFLSAFFHQPPNCDTGGAVCSGLRAAVVLFSFDSPPVVPRTLYRCRFDIASDAPPGTHPLRLSGASYSTADGTERPLTAIDGAVIVAGDPLETRTPRTPRPTPRVLGPDCTGDCDASGSVDTAEEKAVLEAIFDPRSLAECVGSEEASEPRAKAAHLLAAGRARQDGCTGAPTATPSRTGSATATLAPSATTTATAPRSPTRTGSASRTRTPTPTVTPTSSSTKSRTPTRTPTRSTTATRTPTSTSAPSSTTTASPTLTTSATMTQKPTDTMTPTSTATTSRTPTRSVTVTRTPTATAAPTSSPTPSPTLATPPTLTQVPTDTLTPTSSATSSRTPTRSPSVTPPPTDPVTATSTPTKSVTATTSPTASGTPSLAPTATEAATSTRTSSPTRTRTATPPAPTPTDEPAPTSTATPTPDSSGGPVVTFFGIAHANGTLSQPADVSPEGIPIYQRPLGFGFVVVVEGAPGDSGVAVGSSSFDYDPDDPAQRPDLQLLTDRPLGNGSAEVCGHSVSTFGGVPAVPSLGFEVTQPVSAAINDFGCRFIDGTGRTRGRRPNSSCVLSEGGVYRFATDQSQIQFCATISRQAEFSLGDTRLRVRLRGVDGQTGAVREIIVRSLD